MPDTSRITNSLPLFSLLYQALNFHHWHLFCVLQYTISLKNINATTSLIIVWLGIHKFKININYLIQNGGQFCSLTHR